MSHRNPWQQQQQSGPRQTRPRQTRPRQTVTRQTGQQQTWKHQAGREQAEQDHAAGRPHGRLRSPRARAAGLLTVGAAVALLAWPSDRAAAEKRPGGASSSAREASQGPLSLGPLPRTGATPRAARCDLTPQEKLVVSELRARLTVLEERRLALEAREAALLTLQTQIGEQLTELRALQKGASVELDTKQRDAEADRAKRIGQLASIVKKMKPNQAAPILARQQLDVAVRVLDVLGARAAGKILASLPPERAVTIAKHLVASKAATAGGGGR